MRWYEVRAAEYKFKSVFVCYKDKVAYILASFGAICKLVFGILLLQIVINAVGKK